MNPEKHARWLAQRIGFTITLQDGVIQFQGLLMNRPYWTYRKTWEEVSSAMSILADVYAEYVCQQALAELSTSS